MASSRLILGSLGQQPRWKSHCNMQPAESMDVTSSQENVGGCRTQLSILGIEGTASAYICAVRPGGMTFPTAKGIAGQAQPITGFQDHF